MSDLPYKVTKTFQALRNEYSNHIYLKMINTKYYVYKQTYEWQPEKRKSRTISEYIGRINSEGIFIRKLISYKEELEKAKALIVANGGRIIWGENIQITYTSPNKKLDANEIETKLLTILSMNARMPVPHIAKMTGLNKSTAYYNIKSLEGRFNIKYTLELDLEKLGYITYLLLIKFDDRIPNLEELKKVFNKNPRIQFAATTKGTYDIVIYLLDEGPIKTEDNLWKFRSETILGYYKARWYLTPLGQIYSFVPLREEFIDNVLKNKEWKKANKHLGLNEEKFMHRELVVLKELNRNSIEDFTVIDKNYNLSRGSSRYTYEELKKKGIIVRPTINMTKIPARYLGIILLETSKASEVNSTRHKILSDIIEDGAPPLNKYALVGNTGAPGGMIFFMPIINEGDLDNVFWYYGHQVKGMAITSMIVTEILVGSLCYRRLDNDYSRQHNLLVELKKAEPKHFINYDYKIPNPHRKIYF